MDALPLLQKCVSVFGDLGHQTPHIGSFDPDTEHQFGFVIRPKQVDLRMSRAGDVNMSRLMIERVDDKPEAVSAMDDNHALI
jgi:hypothetical protein